MKKQDILKNQVKIVFLGIGSNLGNKYKYISLAKFYLQFYGLKILKCSSNFETLSWPNPKNPKFINIVLKISTIYSPLKLLKICNEIEYKLGRVRNKKNEPRKIDIDILDYNKKIISIKSPRNLKIPHPYISKRNFVLLPLYEISKSWRHPVTKKTITKLINLLEMKDLRSIKQI